MTDTESRLENALAERAPAIILPAERPTLYRPLGAYRFSLAVMVLLAHFDSNIADPAIESAMFPFGLGILGVSAFFVVSGMVIAEAADLFYRRRPLAFLANRCLRLFPMLLVSLILGYLTLCGFAAWGPGKFLAAQVPAGHLDSKLLMPGSLLRNLLLVVPGIREAGAMPDLTIIPVLWTLREELGFYLVVFAAILLATLASRRQAAAYTGVFALLMGGLGLFTLAMFALFAAGRAPAFFSFGPFFAFGVLLYHRRGAQWPVTLAAALAFGLIIAAFFLYLIPTAAGFAPDPRGEAQIAPAAVLALFLLWMLLLDAAFARKIPYSPRCDRLLGDLTYPLYLNHVTAGVVVLNLAGRGRWPFFAAIALALVLSWLAMVTVEPLVRVLRDRIRGRTLL